MNQISSMNGGGKSGFSVSQRGFTLIEMIAVITIIAILMALAAPVMFKGVGSSRLTGVGDRMLGALSEAQQMVFTKNYTIEMRFYKFGGLVSGDATDFRGYQVFKISTKPGSNTEIATKVTECVKFPDGVMISGSNIFSPMLTGTALPDTENNAALKTAATYIAVRFLPDGTCRKIASATSESSGTTPAPMTFSKLPESFFTLLADDGKTYGATNMPKNFYSIQIDPFTGKSRAYRPGL